MLATLNSKQIIDAIARDAVNDPHDVLDISADVVRASRAIDPAPTLAPEFTVRPDSRIQGPTIQEPKIQELKIDRPVIETTPLAAAPPLDAAVRVTTSDAPVARKRSSVGKWLGGAALAFFFALGSAGATILWETHGDIAKQMIATWLPALTASPSQAAATTDSPAGAPDVATADQPVEPTASQPQASPAEVQDAATTATPDAAQTLQSMTRDLAAMAQQIEQLKGDIAELKAGQQQMARETAKPVQPKPAEARAVDPRAKLSAAPRPAAPHVRKPKPKPVYTPTYAPVPIAPPPPPSQATALPPRSAAAAQPQVADDDGPVVRPPMPVY